MTAAVAYRRVVNGTVLSPLSITTPPPPPLLPLFITERLAFHLLWPPSSFDISASSAYRWPSGRHERCHFVFRLHWHVPSPVTVFPDVRLTCPPTTPATVMEELACVRCMSSKFRNPNLVFSFNVCGHTMCANCIEVAFMKGKRTVDGHVRTSWRRHSSRRVYTSVRLPTATDLFFFFFLKICFLLFPVEWHLWDKSTPCVNSLVNAKCFGIMTVFCNKKVFTNVRSFD